jgi:hypothetical protein
LSEHPFTGFCGVTKSDYGKLVLWTRSISLIRLPLSDGWNNTDWISAKIKESSNFQEGIATMRQFFGMLDMGCTHKTLQISKKKLLK